MYCMYPLNMLLYFMVISVEYEQLVSNMYPQCCAIRINGNGERKFVGRMFGLLVRSIYGSEQDNCVYCKLFNAFY